MDGIGLAHYEPSTGQISTDPGLPWTPDITTQVNRANGLSQKDIMLQRLPGYYGGWARFLTSESLATYANGVIKLDSLKGPTTLGYAYGGIYSNAAQTGGPGTFTTASSLVFKITLVPKV